MEEVRDFDLEDLWCRLLPCFCEPDSTNAVDDLRIDEPSAVQASDQGFAEELPVENEVETPFADLAFPLSVSSAPMLNC